MFEYIWCVEITGKMFTVHVTHLLLASSLHHLKVVTKHGNCSREVEPCWGFQFATKFTVSSNFLLLQVRNPQQKVEEMKHGCCCLETMKWFAASVTELCRLFTREV